MSGRMLVAGIGNVFLGDDGFGVEVALRLRAQPLPDGVTVGDFGVAGMHLAFEMLDGYDTTVMVDALPRGEEPGTVFLLEPDLDRLPPAAPDAHGMDPVSVLAMVERLGGTPGRVLMVGCEPLRTEDDMGLSRPVAEAVDEAVALVRRLIDEHAPALATPTAGTTPSTRERRG